MPLDRPVRLTLTLAIFWCAPAWAASAEVTSGEVRFEPSPTEATTAERFRLAKHVFAWQMTAQPTASREMDVFRVTFPSPVTTPQANNNTVHCEYFRAHVDRAPAVIVLHILGGDFDLARFAARHFAARGISALFLKMPHYGPRATPGEASRMVSLDPHRTVDGMTQAVLDIRRATAWLASRAETAPHRIGVFGISLGGITGALAASAEPRLQHVAIMLAGGGVSQVAWDAPELARVRDYWLNQGETKESFVKLLSEVDPAVYASRLKGRRMLMMNARFDEIVPAACAEELWTAAGKPEIVWFNAGHYSAFRFLYEGLERSADFFLATEP